MKWSVTIHRNVEKQLTKLPEKVLDVLARLLAEIEVAGPVQVTGRITRNWQATGTTAT